MAKSDKSKVQKITEIDFSKEGCHVALVDSAANGKQTPLIVKSVEPVVITKGEYFDGDDENSSDVRVNMSLEDVLVMVFGAWKDEAKVIANSIVKGISDPEEAVDLRNKLIGGLTLNGGVVAATPVVATPLVAKSNETQETEEEDDMTPEEFMKSEEGQKMIKAAVDAAREEDSKVISEQAEKLEGFEKAEENRQAAKYDVMAENYEILGAGENGGAVLKSLAEADGEAFEAIKYLLDNAVDTIKKGADLMSEEGEDGDLGGMSKADELETLAEKRAEDDGVTIQKARVLVAKENPHLTV